MNVAEFESWLNSVENPSGDFSQAGAKRVLLGAFRQSQDNYQTLLDDAVEMRKRLAESQARATHWAAKATEEAGENKPLRTRVKTLEDALGKYGRHDLTCPCSYFSVGHVCECGLEQALAAKDLVPIWSGSDARKSGNEQDSEGRTGSESMRKVQ